MKRMMQRQGQLEADGSAATRRAAPQPRAPKPTAQKESVFSKIAEFFRGVRSELRQVAWPTRPEVARSFTVVLVTLIIMVSLIFLLNDAFSHAFLFLFKT
jgi:preprotein translocase subunit SecE